MQRWILAALAVALVAALAYHAIVTSEPAVDAAPVPSASAAASAPASAAPVAPAPEPDGGVADASGPASVPGIPFPVPPLPNDAPSAVHFGVVLFSYEGAEFAKSDARSRKEALRLAEESLSAARDDFAAAVKLGDPGSTEDAGRIPRGVLEPAVEYALFTLKKDEVYGAPIDTPRGYWIIRRNR